MTSSGGNVSFVTLDGLEQLWGHRWFFFCFFSCVYVFVLFSDALVVYVICSHRKLHRPRFVLVAAALLNSLAGSTVMYPPLLAGLGSGHAVVRLSRGSCLTQAFASGSLGASSFLILAAMALDRYLSICQPLRYRALLPPKGLAALLLACWLLPTALMGSSTLQALHVPLCQTRLRRLYCDMYTFVSLSCGGGGARLLQAYGMVSLSINVLAPSLFVLFSYGAILLVCLRRSRTFSSKALSTCGPHLIVFINYFLSVGVGFLQRRMHWDTHHSSVVTSVLVVVIPSVCNPLIYGLKVRDIYTRVRALLACKAPD